MSATVSSSVSRFVHLYKGIEEFYFLNKEGELGYIKSGELRSVKETFPQLKDREFLHANPDFIRELEEFIRELDEISAVYMDTPPYDLELGYVLPANGQHRWRSSTLALHKHVLESLKADHEVMVKNGTKDLVEAERDLGRIASMRSIHEGLDELTHHKNAFDQYRYFPALFVLPERHVMDQPDRSKSNVRVINLRWREKHSIPTTRDSAGGARNRELVFAVLRDSLRQRGAIDRTQRLENRLSIA